MMRGSKGIGKGVRPRLESQNDEAYLTGRHTAQEKEKQIRTPLQQESGTSGAKRRGARSRERK